MRFYADSELVTVSDELGRGGEGIVYALLEDPDRAAKIYTLLPGEERVAKLTWMVQLGAQNPQLGQSCAWPLVLLRDAEQQVCGFLMQRLPEPQALHDLYSPEQRKLRFPHATWRTLAAMAAECARRFAVLHARQVLVGDVNERNLLVDAHGRLGLVDADSFQLQHGEAVYVTGVGVVDYTPPELQGSNFTQLVRTADHDCFGLAVLLFKLLFMGRHPFSGGEDGDLSAAIAARRYDYADVSERLRHLVPLTALPRTLQELFSRALAGDPALGPRPTAAQWAQELDVFAGSLVPCEAEPLHMVPPSLSRCPWCQIEAALHYAYFARPGSEKYLSDWTPREDQLQDLRKALYMTNGPPDPTVYLVPNGVPGALALARRVLHAERPTDGRAWYAATLGGLATLGGVGRLASTGPDVTALTCMGLGVVAWVGARWWAWRSQKPLQRALSELAALLQEVEHAGNTWRAEAYQYRNRDRQLLHDFARLALQHESVVRYRTTELMRLTSDSVDEEARHLLERVDLQSVELPSVVSSALRQAMRIRGILHAADLERPRLAGLPGFSPAVIDALIQWRQALEVRLGGQRRAAVRPEHHAAIDNNCEVMQLELEDQMAQLIADRVAATEQARAFLDRLYEHGIVLADQLNQRAEQLWHQLRHAD